MFKIFFRIIKVKIIFRIGLVIGKNFRFFEPERHIFLIFEIERKFFHFQAAGDIILIRIFRATCKNSY